MNFDELANPATDSDSGHSVDPETQEHQSQHSSQEALSLPSVPLDPEWVSPFTLPPLPALRKNRGHSNLLRSPEERLQHQRSSSSAYYAAAWGSPYATPSPYRSPSQQRLRRRSQDIETASPLSARTREVIPQSTNREDTLVSSKLKPSEPAPSRRRANSWDKSTSLSERFNWLSESDLSGSELDHQIGKTPTRNNYLKNLKASVDKVNVPRSRSHQVQESVATITPESFNAAIDSIELDDEKTQALQTTMERSASETMDERTSSAGVDKPLPRLPTPDTNEKKAETTLSNTSPDSLSRPRMPSTQSFQRPKRKVVWKGKTCIIALPLTDRETAGLPPLLTSDEIKQRMQKWISEGYDTDILLTSGPQDTSPAFVQSRPLYPDPQDLHAERKNGKLHVYIPNSSEWDAWVEYLKEEKLRALGVTPSNSEAPMSVQSPFSSTTLSRVSSAYPSLAASPPVGTLSANGNPVRIASNTFSPPLAHQGGMHSHGGSHMPSPSISGYPGPMHGYKQSIAGPRLTSPYDYPVSHPGSYGAGMRNTPNGYGMRQFSPPTAANLQSLGQVLSPMIPIIPSNDNGRGMSQNPTMEQIRQQQQRQQQLHQHMMQHQRQYSYFSPPQSKSADQVPRTPIAESPARRTPEIMHPTPRSHRHNLSAALQKGVDEAEAARGDSKTAIGEVTKPAPESQPVDEPVVDAVAEEEELEQELPVLKRPETLPDGDDKSEIETNPSIAASPMLMDDKNPFSAPFPNLQQIKEALQPQPQHKPKPSISALNVEAPVFDPLARFSNSKFTFGEQPLSSTATSLKKSSLDGSRPSFTPKNLSISKLNIDAPTFTPSFVAQSTPGQNETPIKDTPVKQPIITPSKSPFTFSSPNFNVDAPEFKPGQSFSFTANKQPLPLDEQASLTSAGSIFGNVTVDPNSKVNRRGTKIIPIVRPKSSEGKEDDMVVDDEGRLAAPSDRQKRARRFGEEEAEELLFASSAPFDHTQGLSNEKGKVTEEANKATTNIAESKEEPDANIADIKANTANEEAGGVKESPTQEEVTVEDTVSTLQDDKAEQQETEKKDDHKDEQNSPADVSRQDVDTAPIVTKEILSQRPEETNVTTPVIDKTRSIDNQDGAHLASSESISQSDHKSKSSLSALAKPFEFRPGAAATFIPQQPPAVQPVQEPRKASGLMASRFATASPTMEAQSSSRAHTQDSPPRELYEYIKPKDADLDAPFQMQEMSQRQSPAFEFPSMPIHNTSQFTRPAEESLHSEAQQRIVSRSPSRSSRVEEPMPSYEEIDAVMKQFENNPELGVERDDTPVKSTPLIDMRLGNVFRSDAPSPSPQRMGRGPPKMADWGLGIHKLNHGTDEVSDWNHEFSPRQEDKLQNQTHYFDNRVNNIVDDIIGSRLAPLEQTLQTIQQSLVHLVDKKSRIDSRRSLSIENKDESDADDADDEDDYEAFEGFSSYRSRSPSRSQRKADMIKAIVTDAMAAYKVPVSEQPNADMSEIRAALEEMRELSKQATQPLPQEQSNIRAMMEDVISKHPNLIASKKQEEHEAIHNLRVEVLESSVKDAEKRAEEESALRKQMSDDMKQLNAKLLEAQEQVAAHREAAEEAYKSRAVLERDSEAHQKLQSDHADLLENNNALEDTLAEYRVTSNKFREDIALERARNQDLIRRMHNLREEFNEKVESRQALRSQMERLQDRMAQVMHDVHAEEAEWRKKEHELVVQNKTTQAALDHEIRHREKIELELDSLDKEHKENIRFRAQYEHAQEDISRLQEQVAKITEESRLHQDRSFKLERELLYTKESTDSEVSQTTAKLQSELEAAKATTESVRSDADAQLSRLQKRLDDTGLELEEQKAKHDTAMSEAVEAHNEALHEAHQKRETALQEQQTTHELRLNDLRERHTRALHNSSDDRRRLEDQLNEKLALGEERIEHLQGQVKDLEERLEITKSAARAAVEAATAKAANIPTPAPSVMASPPQRVSGASLQMMKGTDLPERISPQAMRESIMVLQDQLQNREQTIEQLEAEIATLDKDAPTKIKERDTEITLLRELLSVRVDDLNEIITTLSQPSYDRIATKNAAIRLRANLQMEQQLKERAAAGGGLTSSLPSLSAISSLAQSPRALPMAAAAALGNWRKARDFSLNAVSDIASNISQTPSKSNASSPSNFLAGIMTPPSTSQRTPPPSDVNPLSPPSMRPLSAAATARKNGGASEARPLRTYSTQARTLSSRQAEKRRESNESMSSESSKRPPQPQPETPTTPTISRNLKHLDLGDDVDEDASPYNASEQEDMGSETAPTEAVAT